MLSKYIFNNVLSGLFNLRCLRLWCNDFSMVPGFGCIFLWPLSNDRAVAISARRTFGMTTRAYIQDKNMCH
jgi:hypothetical protein